MTEKNFTVNSGLVVKNGHSCKVALIDFSGVSGGGIELTDLSIHTASGGGSLTYDNTTGQFTFVPADFWRLVRSGGLGSYGVANSTGTAASGQ